MKNKPFIIAIGIVLVLVGGFFGLKSFFIAPEPVYKIAEPSEQTAPSAASQVVPYDASLLVKMHSPVKGAQNARVTVVEYLDPECESCRLMYPAVKKILKDHGNDVKFVVRYMTYHKNSKLAANVLEGARAEGKYWEALDLMFEHQDVWANHHNPNPEMLHEVLKPLGLNMKKIMADAKAGKYDAQILEDVEDGKKLNVQGTPSFFVNGQQLQQLGYEPLNSAIVESLKQ